MLPPNCLLFGGGCWIPFHVKKRVMAENKYWHQGVGEEKAGTLDLAVWTVYPTMFCIIHMWLIISD